MTDRVRHLRGPPSTGFSRTMCGLDRDATHYLLGEMEPLITSLRHHVTCAECKAADVERKLRRADEIRWIL